MSHCRRVCFIGEMQLDRIGRVRLIVDIIIQVGLGKSGQLIFMQVVYCLWGSIIIQSEKYHYLRKVLVDNRASIQILSKACREPYLCIELSFVAK